MNGIFRAIDRTSASSGITTHGQYGNIDRNISSNFAAESRLNCGLMAKLLTGREFVDVVLPVVNDGVGMDMSLKLNVCPADGDIIAESSSSSSSLDGKRFSIKRSCFSLKSSKLSRKSSSAGMVKSMLKVLLGPGGGGRASASL